MSSGMASYNTKTINQWYRVKKTTPSAQQEHDFWEKVFAYEPENFVRETIVHYDLGHVLQQYLNQRHEVFAKQLKTHPSYVQAHMECWWQDLCTKRTSNCTRVLHAFFSRPNTAMASVPRQSQRVEDMMNAHLWDMALENMTPHIDTDVQWKMLEKIMSNDGDWIKKNEWSGAINKLGVYLSKGGSSDMHASSFYKHIFYTHWVSDILILPRYTKQRNKMLKQLFRLGVNFTNVDLNSSALHSHAAANIQLAWDEHTKENLLKTVQGSGCSPTKRKM